MAFQLFSDYHIRALLSNQGIMDFSTDAEMIQAQLVVNGVIERVEKYLNRKLSYQMYAQETVIANGNILILERYPIVAINNVIDASGNTVDESYYAANKDPGYIRRDVGSWILNGEYIVNYDGGYYEFQSENENALPYGLAEPLIVQIKYDFQNRNTFGFTSISTENTSYEKVNAYGLLEGVMTDLNSYAKPEIVYFGRG